MLFPIEIKLGIISNDNDNNNDDNDGDDDDDVEKTHSNESKPYLVEMTFWKRFSLVSLLFAPLHIRHIYALETVFDVTLNSSPLPSLHSFYLFHFIVKGKEMKREKKDENIVMVLVVCSIHPQSVVEEIFFSWWWQKIHV